MASEVYTAQEMREMANREKFKCSFVTMTLNGGIILNCTSDVRAMLLQAADLMEREEKRRDKKYEYEVHYTVNGKVFHSTGRAHSLKAAKCILTMYKGYKDAKIVRREIVEWEEVSEEEIVK